jgi:hypothetical protein
MSYPLAGDLAADGIPVAVTCRVLGFSRQAFYAWRQNPVPQRDWDEAHLINAALGIHADDPAFGYRFIAGELPARGISAGEGVVHYHVIIRLDGPIGPGSAPPAWATMDLLTTAIAQAADATHLETPDAPGLPARTLAWGHEHDTRPITATGELTDIRVAAYVAKYATKAAECTGTLDRRITPADQLAELPVREHARRLIATCLRLGTLPELAVLRLTAWAHMLGFRGHFSTKSRHYSTTFGALRAERAQHQRDHAPAGASGPSPTTTPRWSWPTGDSPGRVTRP